MTEIQSARSEPVLVGIDTGKNRHEVLIEVPGRKRRHRVTMLNTRADFDRQSVGHPDDHRIKPRCIARRAQPRVA